MPRATATRRPDIHAVARHAGVSHQTVSRVLNDSPRVRPDTRQRVRDAMDLLGYTPNVAARMLITRRSQTLGVVVLNHELFGPAASLHHLGLAARAQGYGVRAMHLAAGEERELGAAVESLRHQLVDAVIVIDPHPEDRPDLSGVAEIPVVALGGHDADHLPSVRYDSGAGVRRAVEHLLALGHRTVHHVAGPRGWAEADSRRTAWRDALRDAGAPVPRVVPGDWSARSGAAAVARCVDRGATAVLCANDQTALGLLHGLAARGVSVPDDMSVVGFDDVPDAAYYQPPLTTLRQDFSAAGRLAVRLAVEQIDEPDRDVGDVTLPPPDLVVRGSTAPARTT